MLKVGIDKLSSLFYPYLGGSRDNFLGFTKPVWFAIKGFIVISIVYRIIETSFIDTKLRGSSIA